MDRIAQGQRVPGAVGTLMTNMAVEVALKAHDVEFVRAKVGDRYVLEELEKRGWLLGGEGSGHLLALDKAVPGEHAVFNLGSETGYSVREVINSCERVSGRRIPTVEKPRRPGDPPRLIAVAEKADRVPADRAGSPS